MFVQYVALLLKMKKYPHFKVKTIRDLFSKMYKKAKI